jgi:hypothetical protein
VASITQPIPEMDQLMEWLPAHIPAMARDESMVSIVHGDYRLDNLMFHPTEPASSPCWTGSCPHWATRWPTSATTAWPGTSRLGLSAALAGWTWQPGHPDEDDYIRLYCERTGLATPEQLQGRLELLHGLQPVPHRRHPAGHCQARGGRHGLQRAGQGSGAGARPWPSWPGSSPSKA